MQSRLGVVLSDVHVPFQDHTACDMALRFIRQHRPDTIHLLGDICDFYACSKFDKDPCRRETLQDELDETAQFLQRIRRSAPSARIIYSEGNHEFRLRRYLRSEAKALASLRSLQLEKLLDLPSLSIQFRHQDEPYRIGSLLYTHGSIVRKWSAYTAKAHFEKYGCSVIHGHTHRFGSFYHSNITDVHGAWENGCLCGLQPEYVESPDWQQGWSVVRGRSGYFHVEQVVVIGGRYHYHGTTYGKKRKSISRIKEI